MSATQTKSSHAYGIGILVVIVALGVTITWYTSYWLPEENQKVFVDEHVLHPDGEAANVEAQEELLGKIEEKIKTTENPDSTVSPDTPEIKANNADLDLEKDTDIGMSDLKKP